jgi:two-component system, OmpR family, response regulator
MPLAPRPARLLVVEDDVKLARTIRRGLEHEGYTVDLAHRGDDAVAMTLASDYDAVLLDVLLPGLDGYEVCRTLRDSDRWLPVLMLTALGEVPDRIRGLDTGADDYLVKPFAFGELVARVRALVRRGPFERPRLLEIGGLIADPLSRRVSWRGTTAELTPREYALLAFMARRPGEPISRANLLEHVWADGGGTANVVDVYVGYVRRKLERPSEPRLIRTVRGLGYALDPR